MTHTDAPVPPTDAPSPYAVPATAPLPGRPSLGAPTGGDPAGGGPTGPRPGAGTPGNRIAVAAFVVGLVSFLLCAVPLVNALSVVGGLVAVALGVAGIRRARARRAGKGFAVWGVVLGALGFLVSAAIWAFIAYAATSLEEGDLDGFLRELATVTGTPVPSATTAETPTTEAAAVDLADVTCDDVALEAVALSQATAAGDPALVDVRDVTVVEDHRGDVTTPGAADEALVLSCLGTATWSDGTETSVETVLLLDSEGGLLVDYVGR